MGTKSSFINEVLGTIVEDRQDSDSLTVTYVVPKLGNLTTQYISHVED